MVNQQLVNQLWSKNTWTSGKSDLRRWRRVNKQSTSSYWTTTVTYKWSSKILSKRVLTKTYLRYRGWAIRSFERLSPDEERKRDWINETIGLSEEALLKISHTSSPRWSKDNVSVLLVHSKWPSFNHRRRTVSALDLSVQAQVLSFTWNASRWFNKLLIHFPWPWGCETYVWWVIHHVPWTFRWNRKAEDIYANPQHIYTKRLLSAIPVIDLKTVKQSKLRRKEKLKFYQENQQLYYDENSRVWFTKSLTHTLLH